jgi:hypothetical protein
MRNAGGYAQIINSGPGQKVRLDARGQGGRTEFICEGTVEFDTYSCAHCNSVRHASPVNKDKDYYFCRNCMARICSQCADYPCTPFMKKVEAAEEADRRLRIIRGT